MNRIGSPPAADRRSQARSGSQTARSRLATALAPGTIGTGLCYPRGDVDYWLAGAPVDPGGSLAVSVRGVPGLTLDVRVQTTSGKDLGRFRVGGESSAPTRVTPGATLAA